MSHTKLNHAFISSMEFEWQKTSIMAFIVILMMSSLTFSTHAASNGVMLDGKLYFLTNPDTQKMWSKKTPQYITRAEKVWSLIN